jgi:hypothetical protein
MTDKEKKPWQYGFDMDYLKGLEFEYERFNSFSCSPFSAYKKNNIAKGLNEDTLKIYGSLNSNMRLMMETRIVKVKSDIVMYRDVIIGTKHKGDRVITNLTWGEGHDGLAADALSIFEEPCWFYLWAEDKESVAIAEDARFKWVGTKVTTFGELIAIYFKDGHDAKSRGFSRVHPSRNKIEDLSIEKTRQLDVAWGPLVEQVSSQLETMGDFTNHYSNYNKGKAWSALSLRGYTPDPKFITKPEEMSKKWKANHMDDIFEMQDTMLRAALPAVEPILGVLPGKLHRIRLMRLAPGGGELTRHTDQVDPDSGTTDGKLMRFHFPLTTNKDVIFSTWGVDGKRKNAHMAIGECWYLDVRKPHAAVNGGTTDRIHLVVDVEANDEVRGMFNNGPA